MLSGIKSQCQGFPFLLSPGLWAQGKTWNCFVCNAAVEHTTVRPIFVRPLCSRKLMLSKCLFTLTHKLIESSRLDEQWFSMMKLWAIFHHIAVAVWFHWTTSSILPTVCLQDPVSELLSSRLPWNYQKYFSLSVWIRGESPHACVYDIINVHSVSKSSGKACFCPFYLHFYEQTCTQSKHKICLPLCVYVRTHKELVG